MNIVAIILARGGSKGIPRKNIKLFGGKPLIVWSIEQAQNTPGIHSVWVSSDDPEILAIAERHEAAGIVRPPEISGDQATSESGWLHAIDFIEKTGEKCELVIGLQPTSPLREPKDIQNGIEIFIRDNLDSLFSGAELGDFFIWALDCDHKLGSVNYDYRHRKRRQDLAAQYVENGSFYIFKPETLRKYHNRLGGKIGIALMELWKSFELDSLENWRMCEMLMRGFLVTEIKVGDSENGR
jgi:CMP-N,N'-diacetyllegionaminic acid synthase